MLGDSEAEGLTLALGLALADGDTDGDSATTVPINACFGARPNMSGGCVAMLGVLTGVIS
jgi:hypothetical protein